MKYIKTYEEVEDNVKVGDTVYCIEPVDNLGLNLGDAYTVDSIHKSKDGKIIYDFDGDGDSWFASRFTKDKNHPKLVNLTANKYNL